MVGFFAGSVSINKTALQYQMFCRKAVIALLLCFDLKCTVNNKITGHIVI